jgi:hypothetical protein
MELCLVLFLQDFILICTNTHRKDLIVFILHLEREEFWSELGSGCGRHLQSLDLNLICLTPKPFFPLQFLPSPIFKILTPFEKGWNIKIEYLLSTDSGWHLRLGSGGRKNSSFSERAKCQTGEIEATNTAWIIDSDLGVAVATSEPKVLLVQGGQGNPTEQQNTGRWFWEGAAQRQWGWRGCGGEAHSGVGPLQRKRAGFRSSWKSSHEFRSGWESGRWGQGGARLWKGLNKSLNWKQGAVEGFEKKGSDPSKSLTKTFQLSLNPSWHQIVSTQSTQSRKI